MGHSTLSTFLDYYFQKKSAHLGWAAREKTRYAFKHLAEFAGFDVSICDLKFADAEDFQDYLAAKVGKSSANSYVAAIRPVFNWACRREMVATNPFCDLKPYKVMDSEIRTFGEAEIAAILAAAQNKLWRARILAALTAGLRRGEVLNLTVSDVDFENQLIRVQPKQKTELTWQWNPKDFEIRTLPLSPELHNLLVSFILPSLPSGQPYLMLTETTYWLRQKQIETMPERIRITPDENWRPFRNLMRRAGVKGSFHDLRRTCLTVWSRTLPTQELMKLAGHSDFQTTLKYYLGVRADIVNLAREASSKALLAYRGDRT